MDLKRLSIGGVRCIESADLTFGPGRSLVVGPNGAGKTSLLESIFLLGRGRSFRTRQARRVARQGGDGFNVHGALVDSRTPGLERRIGLAWAAGQLSARVDGAPAGGLAELARAFPVHVVDPKLHDLIEAGPSERRRFLDGGVFHVEHGYLSAWRGYRRVLAQRNAALKQSVDAAAHWDQMLVEQGERVDAFRRAYCRVLAPAVREIASRLVGVPVTVQYHSGWARDVALGDALASSRDRDRQLGTTQVGPHRADLGFRFEQGQVREMASRGQQKLVAASLVLGQIQVLQQDGLTRGMVLVDDPAAELDDASLTRLLDELTRLGAQTVITGLRLQALQPVAGDAVFHVEQGRFKQVVY